MNLKELPLRMELGSSTHHPEQKVGQSTSDIKLWLKWKNGEWFKPYGHFNKTQIYQMLEVCRNEYQVEAIMQMLALTQKQPDAINEANNKTDLQSNFLIQKFDGISWQTIDSDETFLSAVNNCVHLYKKQGQQLRVLVNSKVVLFETF